MDRAHPLRRHCLARTAALRSIETTRVERLDWAGTLRASRRRLGEESSNSAATRSLDDVGEGLCESHRDSISLFSARVCCQVVETQNAIQGTRCPWIETGKGTRVTLRTRAVTQNGENTSSTFCGYSCRASGPTAYQRLKMAPIEAESDAIVSATVPTPNVAEAAG